MDLGADVGLPSVAMLGLGAQGGAMAERLCELTRPTLWNRSANPLLRQLAEDAVIAPTAAIAAAEADVIITCLTADDAVREVILGSDGVATTARPGSVVVDCSTISPDTAREVGSELERRGINFLDAPVTGGPEGARTGQLVWLCGGRVDALEIARPILELLGRSVVHLGDVGAGQTGKAVNQVILAGTFLGVAEGIALAHRSGLDAETLIDALQDGAARSWVLAQRSDMMLSGTFTPPRARLAISHKDLRIVQQIVRDMEFSLPGVDLVVSMYDRIAEAGRDHEDVAVIITALE